MVTFRAPFPVQATESTAPRPEPIPWLRALKSEVQPTTYKKGREYAQSRRVSGLARDGDKVKATVTGSSGEAYQVELTPTEPMLSHCTCESWGKYGPHCKHVVAAALLYAARSRRQAQEQAQTQEQGQAGEPSAAAPSAEDSVSLPGLAKLESWLGLSTLPEYEFLYRLTPASLEGRRTWTLDVRRKDQQTQGPVQVKRLLSQGTRLSAHDERIFVELSRHESRYDARILLSDEDLCELLPLLRDRKVIYRGTPLLFDDQPAHVQVHLESLPDGATAALEIRLPSDLFVPLRDGVLLVGRNTFFIAGQTLHPVTPHVAPRLWRKWLLEPNMSFSTGQLDRALTFFAAHLPRFELSLRADGVEVDDQEAPHFILTLEGDAEHVLARLAARYGQTTVAVSPTAVHLGYASAVGGGRKLYRRREETERGAARELTSRGLKFDSNANVFEAAGDAALKFWSEGIKELPAEWERFGTQALKVRVRPRLKPRIRVSMSGVQWFELESAFVADDQVVDLGAVRMWLESGRRFVPLKDGSYAEADPVEIKRAADLLEEAGARPGSTTTRLPLYQSVAVDLLASLGEVTEIEAKAKRALTELRERGDMKAVPVPEGLTATLRHYQESGLAWLYFLHRHGLSGILADDMGLGKTVQALALLQALKNDEGHKPCLVVAPTSVLPNWQREAERFTPGLSVLLWHGQDRKENNEPLSSSDVVLTSYALVRRDLEALSKVPFRYVLLDEAQNIKNADSATAQACKNLPSDQRLALTGTPLENRLSELWSIFDFLMPGFLGSLDAFSERYEGPIQVAADPEARERLRRRIQPFILRRLKTEVAQDLPPKTDTVAYCEMEPGQAALYREVLQESRKQVNETIEKVGFKRSRVSILAALMRLRQVCCDPRLLKLPPGTLLPSSAKLARFYELVDDLVAEGHRALVFSQFTEMLTLLKDQADERKIPYLYLDGRTKDRMSRVDQFNAPEGPPLFFISLKAGGTGLNLTAADYVIHYDPWWNPAVEDQATDRAYRIGQKQAVIAYKLITRGTVEEKILALQKRKRELAEGVLGGGGGLLSTLTEHDVEDLFKPPED